MKMDLKFISAYLKVMTRPDHQDYSSGGSHQQRKMRDPLNSLILPLIGAAILFALWYYDILPWKVIKAFLTTDL